MTQAHQILGDEDDDDDYCTYLLLYITCYSIIVFYVFEIDFDVVEVVDVDDKPWWSS